MMSLGVKPGEKLCEGAVREHTKGERPVSGASRRELLLVVSSIVAALALRASMLRFGGEITGDGVWYALLGKKLIEGDFRGGLSTYWSPLYPFLIGVTSLFSGDFELAGRLVSMVAGSLLVIPVYLLARQLYGKTEAGIAALLTAICPTLILSSTRVLSESLFTLLFTLAVLTTMSAFTKERRWLFFLAGAGFGACYLVKPEAIGFGVLIVVLAASKKLFNRNAAVRSVLAGALLAALGCGVFSLPYILYLRSETGSWTVSEKLTGSFGTSEARNKWRGLIEDGQTTMADKLWAGHRSSSLASEGAVESVDPGSTARKTLQLPGPRALAVTLYREYESFFTMMTPLLVFLIGMGLVSTGWSPERAGKEAYLSLFVICMALGYAGAGFENRYFEALCPIWIIWSSRGLTGLERRLCAIEKGVRRSAGFLRKHPIGMRAVLLVCLAASLAPSLRSGAAVESGASKQLALWIKRDSEPSRPLIMASDPRMAFYSGGNHLYIPTEEYEAVIDYARRRGVDYLVVEERAIRTTPKLSFLLEDNQNYRGLKLVHKDDTPQQKVRVFTLSERTEE